SRLSTFMALSLNDFERTCQACSRFVAHPAGTRLPVMQPFSQDALFSNAICLCFFPWLQFVRGSFAKQTPSRSRLSASVLSSASLQFPFPRLQLFPRSLPSTLRDNRPCIFPAPISTSCYR